MAEASEEDKGILDEAYQRGYDYLLRGWGCASTVFGAVMDTLGYEDDPIVNDVWKAILGLSGGTGNMAIGTCGALAGAASAISYSFGFTKEDLKKDSAMMLNVNSVVANIGEKMQDKYSNILCQEVQFHHWGKAYRFTNPQALQEWREITGFKTCQKVTGDLSRWTVEKILEYSPQLSKRKNDRKS